MERGLNSYVVIHCSFFPKLLSKVTCLQESLLDQLRKCAKPDLGTDLFNWVFPLSSQRNQLYSGLFIHINKHVGD